MKLSGTMLMLYLVTQCISPAYARLTMETIRWAQYGELTMPPEVQQAKSPADLDRALRSEDVFTRAAAVRKLGELGGQQAISSLLQAYRGEAPLKTPESLPIVRMEIARTLGKIGTTSVGPVIASLIEDEWAKRPKEGGTAETRWMSESCPVIAFLLRELPPHASDERVFRVVDSVANAQDISRRVVGIREDIGILVWHVYLKGRIARDKMSEGEQMEYLLDFNDRLNEAGRKEGQWSASVRHSAARIVLSGQYDGPQLQTLAGQIQERIDKYGVASEKDAEYNKLRGRLSYVNRILWEKSNEKEKDGAGGKETKPR